MIQFYSHRVFHIYGTDTGRGRAGHRVGANTDGGTSSGRSGGRGARGAGEEGDGAGEGGEEAEEDDPINVRGAAVGSVEKDRPRKCLVENLVGRYIVDSMR